MATFFGSQGGHCGEVQLYKTGYRFEPRGGTSLYKTLLSTPPDISMGEGKQMAFSFHLCHSDNKLEINLNMTFPSSNDSNFQNEA